MQIDNDLDDISFICTYYKKTTLLKYPPQSQKMKPHGPAYSKNNIVKKRDKLLSSEMQKDVFSSCLIFFMHSLMIPSSQFQPLYQCINSMLILAIMPVLSPV